ncbi:methyltransferase [Streptomyces aquilus]|uniref:methyltransferase n=1 Tax=Streptomyces aquilus TaxID=2548456 RepID=UPI0036AC0978
MRPRWSSSAPGRPASCSALSSQDAGIDCLVLERAERTHLRARARAGFLAGDFADVPTGGDVYVLSRVLPDDGSVSPATAWDLHMMCNVGGRERGADHYGRLFADAGLTGGAPSTTSSSAPLGCP